MASSSSRISQLFLEFLFLFVLASLRLEMTGGEMGKSRSEMTEGVTEGKGVASTEGEAKGRAWAVLRARVVLASACLWFDQRMPWTPMPRAGSR
jgi:hypothetical protein